MSDTPRTSNAWHEARHGENPNALLEESAKLERELAEARRVGGNAIVNTQLIEELATVEKQYRTLREGVEKLAVQYDNTAIYGGKTLGSELRTLLK